MFHMPLNFRNKIKKIWRKTGKTELNHRISALENDKQVPIDIHSGGSLLANVCLARLEFGKHGSTSISALDILCNGLH